MKQLVTNTSAIPSLDGSLIDEKTRKGWEYYAEHSGKRSSKTGDLSSRETSSATTNRKQRTVNS